MKLDLNPLDSGPVCQTLFGINPNYAFTFFAILATVLAKVVI
jgi:hypothetical protein